LKDADLITGKIVTVDGTKVRAHNSKKKGGTFTTKLHLKSACGA
jgi:hypothetical protein